jgi:hypothetical protein
MHIEFCIQFRLFKIFEDRSSISTEATTVIPMAVLPRMHLQFDAQACLLAFPAIEAFPLTQFTSFSRPTALELGRRLKDARRVFPLAVPSAFEEMSPY